MYNSTKPEQLMLIMLLGLLFGGGAVKAYRIAQPAVIVETD